MEFHTGNVGAFFGVGGSGEMYFGNYKKKKLPILTSDEWVTAVALCKICKPFRDVTVSISREAYCTGSLVIPTANGLLDVYRHLRTEIFSNTSKKVIEIFLNGIRERFSSLQHSNTLMVATFLDPRFKLVALTDESAAHNTKKLIKRYLIDMQREEIEFQTERTEENIEKSVSIWSSFDKYANEHKPHSSVEAKAIFEIQRYLEDGLFSRSCNSFHWWLENKYRYPKMAELAKKYLCVLASSVPCERIFSKAGGLFCNSIRKKIYSNSDFVYSVTRFSDFQANFRIKYSIAFELWKEKTKIVRIYSGTGWYNFRIIIN
ncbi:zinc finger BED domain-containing protein 4-like [Bactrocera dorsalis]|uniref:Zinc finger BED domain-containing protein 4-like n=1 Tax=Bactrocera dorsalis TaxID=27457 RepID=A0ABM3IYI5_BACDO|nr:zinc finger BED domain-containing protein 4-like [Bactrocera dorsalis]